VDGLFELLEGVLTSCTVLPSAVLFGVVLLVALLVGVCFVLVVRLLVVLVVM